MNWLQGLINNLYRFPKARWKHYQRFGGYQNFKKMLQGNEQMKKAAIDLPSYPSHPDGNTIYFLTGRKYLHQTLFCIASLVKVCAEPYRFVFVDDGSLNNELIALINEKTPGAIVVGAGSIEENLDKLLPVGKFPTLRSKRTVYPHLKKITDIHTLGITGWKMVLDSDMLFWEEPIELKHWFQQQNLPVHMVDCTESYGYSRMLMETLCGTEVPEKLNAGIAALQSSSINWVALEHWVTQLEEREGASYFLEQALTAMLLGETPALVLPADKYVVNPAVEGVTGFAGTLHHYVDLSKEVYLKKAWQKIL
jgi:hypothetical protein